MRDTPTDSDLTLGEYSSRVTCVVDIVGTADAAIPDMDPSFQPFVTDLMGGTASEVPESYRDASPLAQVDGDTVPFLIFHGTDDENTSVEQSRILVDALHAAGVEVVYVEYPHADHFSWLEWDVVAPETLAFLGRHLAAPAN
jgi:dipeptidyl aminopeptidase/acylaminoacyl peptidase